MEMSGETMDEDLRERMQKNSQLCELYAALDSENLIVRMAILASKLSSEILNATHGEAFDTNIFNALCHLVPEETGGNIEHASMLLACKNLVMLGESFERLRQKKAAERERVLNVPEYDEDQHAIEEDATKYMMEKPQKRPQHEEGEDAGAIIHDAVTPTSRRVGKILSHEVDHDMEEHKDYPDEMEHSEISNESSEKRRTRRISYEGLDEDEEDEESTYGDISHHSSNKRAKPSHATVSKMADGSHVQVVDPDKSLIMKERVKKRMMNSPVTKTAAAFDLKTNIIDCPFCNESFRLATLDLHFRADHEAEKHVKLFGCAKCDAWYRVPNNALRHHRKKGCEMSIRTVEEAKKWFALKQLMDSNVPEENEEEVYEYDTEANEVSKLGDTNLEMNNDNELIMKDSRKNVTKTAAAFGLKINTMDCPFCKKTYGLTSFDLHFRADHEAEKHVKLFGCAKCDAWYRVPNDGLRHHRKKGCEMSIRTVEEAKKWFTLKQLMSSNVPGPSKNNEEEMPDDDTETSEASQLGDTNLEMILAMTEVFAHQQKNPAYDKIVKNENEEE